MSAEIEFKHPTDRPSLDVIDRAALASLEAMQRYLAVA